MEPRYRRPRPDATRVRGGDGGVADRGEGEAGGVGGRAAVDAADGLRAAPQIPQVGDAAVPLELAEGDVVHRKPEEGALREGQITTPLKTAVNLHLRFPLTVKGSSRGSN